MTYLKRFFLQSLLACAGATGFAQSLSCDGVFASLPFEKTYLQTIQEGMSLFEKTVTGDPAFFASTKESVLARKAIEAMAPSLLVGSFDMSRVKKALLSIISAEKSGQFRGVLSSLAKENKIANLVFTNMILRNLSFEQQLKLLEKLNENVSKESNSEIKIEEIETGLMLATSTYGLAFPEKVQAVIQSRPQIKEYLIQFIAKSMAAGKPASDSEVLAAREYVEGDTQLSEQIIRIVSLRSLKTGELVAKVVEKSIESLMSIEKLSPEMSSEAGLRVVEAHLLNDSPIADLVKKISEFDSLVKGQIKHSLMTGRAETKSEKYFVANIALVLGFTSMTARQLFDMMIQFHKLSIVSLKLDAKAEITSAHEFDNTVPVVVA
ncbi:MAG: hypothetical protein AABY64_01955 [Bdellovibrionota bacterium]|mgnify:FL=1